MSEYREIKKPVVPKYVAHWYEENKDNFEDNLAYLLNDYLNKNFAFIEDSNLKVWLDNDFNLNKPIQTLVNMHQFGYKVKTEKLYTVEIPTTAEPDNVSLVLGKNKSGKVDVIRTDIEGWKNLDMFHLNEEEIREAYPYPWIRKEEVID